MPAKEFRKAVKSKAGTLIDTRDMTGEVVGGLLFGHILPVDVEPGDSAFPVSRVTPGEEWTASVSRFDALLRIDPALLTVKCSGY